MISIQNLHKSFSGKKVLENINLEISKGEIFGIVGLSGAGKSTLIRLINKLETLDEGKILIENTDISNLNGKELSYLRREISMIFQHFNLLSSRTVYSNIMLPLELDNKLSKEEKQKRVEEVLELVKLSDKKNVYINNLSGGQKQRVAIARALVTKPKILLSDEATSALDPITANNILELLKDINKKLDITIVLITHQMEVIKRICDKIAVIKDGKILEQGPTADIFFKAKDNFTKKLIRGLESDMPTSKKYILHFLGKNADKSYISQAMKKFKTELNILAGGIHELSNNEKVGYLVISIENDSDSDQILEWFRENQIEVEEIDA